MGKDQVVWCLNRMQKVELVMVLAVVADIINMGEMVHRALYSYCIKKINRGKYYEI